MIGRLLRLLGLLPTEEQLDAIDAHLQAVAEETRA